MSQQDSTKRFSGIDDFSKQMSALQSDLAPALNAIKRMEEIGGLKKTLSALSSMPKIDLPKIDIPKINSGLASLLDAQEKNARLLKNIQLNPAITAMVEMEHNRKQSLETASTALIEIQRAKHQREITQTQALEKTAETLQSLQETMIQSLNLQQEIQASIIQATIDLVKATNNPPIKAWIIISFFGSFFAALASAGILYLVSVIF